MMNVVSKADCLHKVSFCSLKDNVLERLHLLLLVSEIEEATFLTMYTMYSFTFNACNSKGL